MIDINRMCDKCFRPVSENEEFIGFNLTDDFGNSRVFKGHETCIEEIVGEIDQIYGNGAENSEKQ